LLSVQVTDRKKIGSVANGGATVRAANEERTPNIVVWLLIMASVIYLGIAVVVGDPGLFPGVRHEKEFVPIWRLFTGD
jgi:hypothetical protein